MQGRLPCERELVEPPQLQSTEWAETCCVKAGIPVNSSHVSAVLLVKILWDVSKT